MAPLRLASLLLLASLAAVFGVLQSSLYSLSVNIIFPATGPLLLLPVTEFRLQASVESFENASSQNASVESVPAIAYQWSVEPQLNANRTSLDARGSSLVLRDLPVGDYNVTLSVTLLNDGATDAGQMFATVTERIFVRKPGSICRTTPVLKNAMVDRSSDENLHLPRPYGFDDGDTLKVVCLPGFVLDAGGYQQTIATCVQGTWHGIPGCISQSEAEELEREPLEFFDSSRSSSQAPAPAYNSNRVRPSLSPRSAENAIPCANYPILPNADVSFSSQDSGRVLRVTYVCRYDMVLSDMSRSVSVVCEDGRWRAEKPETELLCRRTCNGLPNMEGRVRYPIGPIQNLALMDKLNRYPAGVKFEYLCTAYGPVRRGNVGKTELYCADSGRWSLPQNGRPIGPCVTCQLPKSPLNGDYVCQPDCEPSSDVNEDRALRSVPVGMQLHFSCDVGYQLNALQHVRVCKDNKGSGEWSGTPLMCLKSSLDPSKSGDGANGGKVSETASSPTSRRDSIAVIVIFTGISVLGAILIALVAFALHRLCTRRRMHNAHHALDEDIGPATLPDSRGSLDSHDRVTLMAAAAFSRGGVRRPHLPSYEDAMRFGNQRPGFRSTLPKPLNTSSHSEVRPLPWTPHMLGHQPIDLQQLPQYVPGGGGGFRTPSSDHSRRTCSPVSGGPPAGREGYHEMDASLGSRETMNVSESYSMANQNADAMTIDTSSVTIETYSSRSSNPSLAMSGKAAAGSLASGSGGVNMENEDAPLLLTETRSLGEDEMSRSVGE